MHRNIIRSSFWETPEDLFYSLWRNIEIVAESGETYRYDFISPFEDEAKLLADRMSAEEDLSAIHFKDIVRDYLTELYLSAIDANNLTSAI